jgi:hypothetical protein
MKSKLLCIESQKSRLSINPLQMVMRLNEVYFWQSFHRLIYLKKETHIRSAIKDVQLSRSAAPRMYVR